MVGGARHRRGCRSFPGNAGLCVGYAVRHDVGIDRRSDLFAVTLEATQLSAAGHYAASIVLKNIDSIRTNPVFCLICF